MSAALSWVLAGACVAPTSAPSPAVPFGAAARPTLCTDPAEPSRLPDDLIAWQDAVHAGDNDFYGHATLNALSARDALNPEDARVLGDELAQIGDLQGAEALLARAADAAESPSDLVSLLDGLAQVQIRRAEVQNCDGDELGRCTFPFTPGGQHANADGMRAAITTLEKAMALDDDPGQQALRRWWITLALGALGDAAPEVADAHRLPLLERQPTPKAAWPDRAEDLGVSGVANAGGVHLGDVDGDGRTDIVLSSMNPDQGMRLYLSMPDGGVCDASVASGLDAVPGVLNFVGADYDGDGDVDLFAPRGGWMFNDGRIRPSLLRNDGGSFVDVAVPAGLADVVGPTQVAAWADVDGDGLLDLFVGREVLGDGGEDIGEVVPSSLYLQRADGGFDDVAEAVGLQNVGWVKGATFADVDADGDPDLWLSSFGEGVRLFLNDGGDFQPSGDTFGPRLAFANAALDYDQDGDLDLLVAGYPSGGNIQTTWALAQVSEIEERQVVHLLRNDGDATFVDVTHEVGLDGVTATMGLGVGDLNADGFPDVLLSTGATSFGAVFPNVAYQNTGDGRFVDVSATYALGHLQKGHAVGFSDLDDDGDQDLVISLGGAYPSDAWSSVVLENPLADATSVTLHLEGAGRLRDARGAIVEVRTDAGTRYALAGPGSSFGGNDPALTVAVPGATRVAEVIVTWPGGERERVDGVILGAHNTITQGLGVTVVTEREPHALERVHDHGG